MLEKKGDYWTTIHTLNNFLGSSKRRIWDGITGHQSSAENHSREPPLLDSR
jgi:hypothetical protein